MGDEMESKLNISFASGTAPDIIGHAIVSIAERAKKGHYAEMDKYFDNYEDKDDILDIAINGFPEYQGKRYGLTFYPIPEPYVYRKDFFVEAGLDPNVAPETWADIADSAVKVVQRDGDIVTRSGLSFPYDGWKFLEVFSIMNGAENIGPNGEPTFDNPEMVEALDYFGDLWEKNVTLEVSIRQEMNLGHIFKGQAAMGYATPHSIIETVENDPDFADKLGFMHISKEKGGQGGAWCGAAFLFMGGETKYPNEAWEFIKFFWEEEEMWTRYERIGAPVVRKSMFDRYMADNPFLNGHMTKYVAVGVGAPKVEWSLPYLFTYLPQAQQEVFYEGKDTQQALSDSVADLTKELSLKK